MEFDYGAAARLRLPCAGMHQVRSFSPAADNHLLPLLSLPPAPLCCAAVQQVRPFGVFVKIDGYRKFGLVHFSQASGMPFGNARLGHTSALLQHCCTPEMMRSCLHGAAVSPGTCSRVPGRRSSAGGAGVSAWSHPFTTRLPGASTVACRSASTSISQRRTQMKSR